MTQINKQETNDFFKTAASKRDKYVYPKNNLAKDKHNQKLEAGENYFDENAENFEFTMTKDWIDELHKSDDRIVYGNNKAIKAPLSREEREVVTFWKKVEEKALTREEYEELVRDKNFISFDKLQKPFHKSLDYTPKDENGDFLENAAVNEVNKVLQPIVDTGRQQADAIVENLPRDLQELYQLIMQNKNDVEISKILNVNKSTVGRRRARLVKEIQKYL